MIDRRFALVFILSALFLAFQPVAAAEASSVATRTDQLRGDLLGPESATQILGRWCAARKLAVPPVIRAIRVRGVDKPASVAVRRALAAHAGDAIRYRRVHLTCGTHVLSEADNWYLPARLTPEMNHALDTTDAPFGAVVRPLAFHRRTLAVTRLYGRQAILRVRAVLISGAGAPFSVVVETYRRDLVAAGPADR